ncbi:hypothetical protein AR9_g031 [Bacillus phage AR9]|uniref:Uncharacterized protein n=1 Tax=Bacillus phage AR9 TaxID=1815509 RepID=A0A172JHU3_BPPB1|nr:hypothetical protein BI022_gp031 [Bacillus phage AR9]AMS01116.1 hypothetical protein AR9_g031 [Bacillus phage AR9]
MSIIESLKELLLDVDEDNNIIIMEDNDLVSNEYIISMLNDINKERKFLFVENDIVYFDASFIIFNVWSYKKNQAINSYFHFSHTEFANYVISSIIKKLIDSDHITLDIISDKLNQMTLLKSGLRVYPDDEDYSMLKTINSVGYELASYIYDHEFIKRSLDKSPIDDVYRSADQSVFSKPTIHESKLNLTRPDLDILYFPLIKDFKTNSVSITLMQDYKLLFNDLKLKKEELINEYFKDILEDTKKRLTVVKEQRVYKHELNSNYIHLIQLVRGKVTKTRKNKINKQLSTSRARFFGKKENYFEGKFRETIFKIILFMIEYFEKENLEKQLESIEKAFSLKIFKNYIGYYEYDDIRISYLNDDKFAKSRERISRYEAEELLEQL